MARPSTLFNATRFDASSAHRTIYRRYEIAYTMIDLVAGAAFLVGSVLFFWKATETAAIWLFTAGSVFFVLRPLARISRELELARVPLPEDDPAAKPGAEDVRSASRQPRGGAVATDRPALS